MENDTPWGDIDDDGEDDIYDFDVRPRTFGFWNCCYLILTAFCLGLLMSPAIFYGSSSAVFSFLFLHVCARDLIFPVSGARMNIPLLPSDG